MKAYVLIEVEMGRSEDVTAAVRQMPGVISADATFGVYDLIVIAEVGSITDLGVLLQRDIQCIPGVRSTSTCLSFE